MENHTTSRYSGALPKDVATTWYHALTEAREQLEIHGRRWWEGMDEAERSYKAALIRINAIATSLRAFTDEHADDIAESLERGRRLGTHRRR